MRRSVDRAAAATGILVASLITVAWLGAGGPSLVGEARAATPVASPSSSPRPTVSPTPRVTVSPSPRVTASPRPTPTVVPTVSLAPIREATIEVKPNQPLVDTGLDVVATDSIHIVATGTIQLIPGDRKSIVDANGDPARLGGCDPEVFCGTLMASLTPTRGWSRAGTEALIPPGGAGRLYLRANIADPGRASGSFTVKIRAGRQALLGVASPSPVGISRDNVQAGGGGAGVIGGAPPLDLAIAAAIAGLGALLGPLLARRLMTRRPGASPTGAAPTGTAPGGAPPPGSEPTGAAPSA